MSRPVVTDLDPNALEPGIHELWLHLVDDALGLPVKLPVLAARGGEDGAVVGITGAVHGDYYFIRVEQVDDASAWTSPFWVGSYPTR